MSVVHAQQTPLNLTAYPATFTLSTTPHNALQEKFRLRNNSDTPRTLLISVKKLGPDAQGNTTIKEFSKTDTYQQWISFDHTTITALPREWVDVAFTLTVPKDTAFGYYYVIYIAPKATAPTTNGQPQATLTGSLAIPILLTVNKPGATIAGRMISFLSSTSFSEYVPINFLTTFVNTGNLFIRPTGNVFIKDWTGNTIDTLTINSSGAAILPGGKRTYTTPWDNSFITSDPIIQDDVLQRDSNGSPKTHLVFHFDRVLNLRIGKYTAIALTVIPTQSRDLSFQTSTTFWVFPWKVVGIALLFIIFAGVGLVNTGKSLVGGIRKIIKR